MHQRWVHERPRPGTQRLPRWDNRPTLAHQVPLHPAGVLPQVSGQCKCVFFSHSSVLGGCLYWSNNVFTLLSALCNSIHLSPVKWVVTIQFANVKFPALNMLFVRYLSNSKEDHQKSIFVQCEKGGYRLKDNVQFHLYISTSPCGDARIFSPHEAGVEGTEHRLAASHQPRLSSSAQPMSF